MFKDHLGTNIRIGYFELTFSGNNDRQLEDQERKGAIHTRVR